MKTLNDIRTKYLGKQGKVTELSKMMKDIPNDQKKEFGYYYSFSLLLLKVIVAQKKKLSKLLNFFYSTYITNTINNSYVFVFFALVIIDFF